MFFACICEKRSTEGNKHRRKVRKRSLQKGKRLSETPTGDGGLGGSTFTTEIQESIELKLHGHIRLTALYLAMVGTPFCRTFMNFVCRPRCMHHKKRRGEKKKKKTKHALV